MSCQMGVFHDENIFGKIGRLSGRFVKASVGKSWFDAAKLERAVKQVIKKELGDGMEGAPLILANISKGQLAKAYVAVLYRHQMQILT